MVARWRCQFWAECMTHISEAGKARPILMLRPFS